MEREVALRERQIVADWQKTFAELFSDQLNRGLPMHRLLDRLHPATFQEMMRQARNAEEALLAAHFCCAEAVQGPSTIDWPDDLALRDLITRLDQGQTSDMCRYCLAWLDAKNVQGRRVVHNLFWANLSDANLAGADLAGAYLEGTYLDHADLAGTNLERANLSCANLEQANLEGASLEGANLSESSLGGANLSGSSLEGANLAGAYLSANLSYANLEGADLAGADLEGADLAGVKNLDHARNLDRVQSWLDARIERWWVERLQLDADQLGLEVVDDLPDDRTPGLFHHPQD